MEPVGGATWAFVLCEEAAEVGAQVVVQAVAQGDAVALGVVARLGHTLLPVAFDLPRHPLFPLEQAVADFLPPAVQVLPIILRTQMFLLTLQPLFRCTFFHKEVLLGAHHF